MTDRRRDDTPNRQRAGPARIGPYRLGEVLGEGGMGTVYLAEQRQPVRRQVALKVIRAGLDSAEVVARFEAERQALALMDHPGIARVLDAGTTDDGRPYFAMERVRGVPITEYCDGAGLEARARIELLVPVCQALQHAHQKGIIHRDLKPSNILVTVRDGEAQPVIIDFGIAKAVGQRLTDRTLHTRHHQILGTPAYMSPEQAEMAPLDIDTRSDVYSLGAVLYELLTGTTPFDPAELVGAGLLAMHRKIREEDPPTPSLRLRGLEEKTATEIARQRRTRRESLARTLRGELDWIVMKCLDKDRMRRYASSSELAADLRRYLGHEAVVAGPPSRLYRLRKLVGKHRLAVSTAALVAATVIVGLAVATWLYLEAEEARRLESAARGEVEQALSRESVQRLRAEALARARTEEAEKVRLSYRFLVGALASPDPDHDGRDVRVTTLLGRARTNLEGAYPEHPMIEASLRETIGGTYQSLGLLEPAEQELRRCTELRRRAVGARDPETLRAEALLAEVLRVRGELDAALTLITGVRDARRQVLGDDHVDTHRARVRRAGVLQDLDRAEEALAELERGLSGIEASDDADDELRLWSRKRHSEFLNRSGDFDAMERVLRLLVADTRELLGERHTEHLRALRDLAHVLMTRQHHLAEAGELLGKCLRIQEELLGSRHPDTLESLNNLAYHARLAGDMAEATRRFEGALERFVEVFGRDHRRTLVVLNNLAWVHLQEGRLKEARELLSDGIGRFQRLEGHVDDRLVLEHTLAEVEYASHHLDDAEIRYRRIVGEAETLLADDHVRLAVYRGTHGRCLTDLGRYDEAEPLLLASARVLHRRFGSGHEHAREAVQQLARLYNAWGKPQELRGVRTKVMSAEADKKPQE